MVDKKHSLFEQVGQYLVILISLKLSTFLIKKMLDHFVNFILISYQFKVIKYNFDQSNIWLKMDSKGVYVSPTPSFLYASNAASRPPPGWHLCHGHEKGGRHIK